MRKLKCILILSVLFIRVANCQQWGLSYVLHSRNIYSVAVINPQNITISGGNDYSASLESVFHSTDFGLNWQENSVDTFNFPVRSIAFSDTMHGLGTGFFGNYVHCSDGGYTWLRDTLPVNRNFFKAVYSTPTKVFLAGGQELGNNVQTVLKSNDGANTWTVVRDTAGPVLRSICFIDSLKGIAVGDSGTILRTFDMGNTWQPVVAPVPFNYNGVTFINADTGYIIGGQEHNDSIRVVLRTTDAGATWNVLQNQPGAWLTDISFLNKDTGYIVGDLATLLETVDGGQTWSPKIVTSATGNEVFTSVRFYNADFGVIGSLYGKVFVYSNPTAPSVKTLGPVYTTTNTGQQFVSLTGLANTRGYPNNVSFVIATDSLFSNMFETPYPATISTDTFVKEAYDITWLALAPGTYFFACKLVNTNSSYYGDTVKFVITDSIEASVVTALPFTNATTSSLTLQGQVSKLPAGANLFFEYLISGDTTVHTVAATPSIISDSLSHAVSANVNGVFSLLVYNYRVKASYGRAVFYSDYRQFQLVSGASVVITNPATNITHTSAMLHGHVNNLSAPATIWFEYMLNGNTITVPGVPASVNDVMLHNVTAQVNGLLADSFYQFRLKVRLDSVQVIFGNYISFFASPGSTGNIVAYTLPATNVTPHSATLQAEVGGLPLPATIWFQYVAGGITTTVAAVPGLINDSLLHNVVADISGLTAYTIYPYRVKVIIDSVVTIYSNYDSFYSNNAFSSQITTQTATNVTGNSAVLNGIVQEALPVTNLTFDYGTSMVFGDSVMATPPVVNDSLSHHVSAPVTGLQANTLYYYRLRGLSGGTTICRDTLQFYTGESEIPNWDFQYWSYDTIPLLYGWHTLTKDFIRVPGHTGNYAIKVFGQNVISLGMFSPGGNGFNFSNGVPFAYRPDSVIAWMKFDLPPGDTGGFIVSLQNHGNVVAQPWCKAGGSTGGVFKRLAFKIDYISGVTPDSVMAAIIVGAKDTITFDDIEFTPSSSPPLFNGDFETWYDYPINDLLSWDYLRFLTFDSVPNFGYNLVSQTLFSAPYDYAAKIQNVYVPLLGLAPGFIGTSEGYLGPPIPSFSVIGRHLSLNGFFKFFPVNRDTMTISIGMFKNGQVVGVGTLNYPDSVTEFMPFDIPITYTSAGVVPDSGSIGINCYNGSPRGPSILIVDKLHFDGLLVGEKEPVINQRAFENSAIKLFPNPANSLLHIELAGLVEEATEFAISDIGGRRLNAYHHDAGAKTLSIDISNLAAGVYLLSAQTAEQPVAARFVKY